MKRLPFTPPMFEAAFVYHYKTVTRRLRTSERPYYKEVEIVVAVTEWSAPQRYNDVKPTNLPDEFLVIGGSIWGKCRPGRHVPLHLEHNFPKVRIVSVRPEHLQDITADEAILEGATMRQFTPAEPGAQSSGWSMDWDSGQRESDTCLGSPQNAFGNYWNRIHGPGAWDKNPPVWRIEFEEV